MLMRWGLAKQKEIKVPGFIHATIQGYGLYIKYGFEQVERFEIDLTELGGQGSYSSIFLIKDGSLDTASW